MSGAASGGEKRIGLLGGTFDPPHNGHVALGDGCRNALRLSKVLVIVAGRPPHKVPASLSSFDHRFEMARLAFRGGRGFVVDALERERAGPSYTVDTLRDVRGREGAGALLWLLMGSDSLRDLDAWKDPDEILRECRLGVYARPGFDPRSASEKWSPHVDLVAGPPVACSSTEIRDRVRAGQSIAGMVPEPVRDYIAGAGLYTAAPGGRAGGGEVR